MTSVEEEKRVRREELLKAKANHNRARDRWAEAQRARSQHLASNLDEHPWSELRFEMEIAPLEAQITLLEAESASLQAAERLSRVLTDVERENDPDAASAHLPSLLERLEALHSAAQRWREEADTIPVETSDEEALVASLDQSVRRRAMADEADRKFFVLVEQAEAAWSRLSARRRAAGDPSIGAFPTAGMWGSRSVRPQQWIASIEARVERDQDSLPKVRTNVRRIRQVRQELEQLMAGREAALRRQREAEEARAERARLLAEDDARFAEQREQKFAAQKQASEKAALEKRELVEDFKARTGRA